MSVSDYLLFAFGVLIYGVTMWDVLKTTLSMHGGGPITGALTRVIDSTITRLGDKAPRENTHVVSRYSNLIITVTLFTLWFTGLLLAATLMLSSDPASVTEVASADGKATWINRIYFVAASLTTAGFGDFVPNGVYWRVLTVVIATSGLVVTSLGISYVVSLVSAVAAQRALARQITNLGRDPRTILAANWDGAGFSTLGDICEAVAGTLVTHTQRHLAYPAIHYVRASDDRDCLPLAVALLDETLTVLIYEAPRRMLPPPPRLMAMRRAITAYLESLDAGFVTERPGCPAWPEIAFLVADYQIQPAGRTRRLSRDDQDHLDRRRQLLRAGVESQGINWDKMYEYLDSPEEDRLDGNLHTVLLDSVDEGVLDRVDEVVL